MTSHSSDNNKFRLELLEGYLRLLRFILFMQIGRSETFGIKRFVEHEINACFFCLLHTDRSHLFDIFAQNPEVEQKVWLYVEASVFVKTANVQPGVQKPQGRHQTTSKRKTHFSFSLNRLASNPNRSDWRCLAGRNLQLVLPNALISVIWHIHFSVKAWS